MSREKIEYVELRLKVPKAVVDCLRTHEKHLGKSAEEYLEYNIVESVRADLEDSDDSPFFNPVVEIERINKGD